ncbi:unnamed protein product [Ectocarpus fasciculatus]
MHERSRGVRFPETQRAADFMLAVKGNSYKGARYDGGD